jgi:hypothetical protein
MTLLVITLRLFLRRSLFVSVRDDRALPLHFRFTRAIVFVENVLFGSIFFRRTIAVWSRSFGHDPRRGIFDRRMFNDLRTFDVNRTLDDDLAFDDNRTVHVNRAVNRTLDDDFALDDNRTVDIDRTINGPIDVDWTIDRAVNIDRTIDRTIDVNRAIDRAFHDDRGGALRSPAVAAHIRPEDARR